MSCCFRHRFAWLLLALALPGFAGASDKNDQGERQSTARAEISPKTQSGQDWPLFAPFALPVLGAEPVLIRFEESDNRFVGTVDMERFLRPGLDTWLTQGAARRPQGFDSSISALVRSSDSGATVLGIEDNLHKSAVLNWAPSNLFRVSLDVVAASGLQMAADSGSVAGNLAPQALGGTGKKPEGLSFSYAAQASSIGTAGLSGLSSKPEIGAFSLQGYQLGLQSSLDLGENTYLGFDFGLGQALSRDISNAAARQLMITSLGVGLGGKRFRARLNSDLFTSGQGLDPNQQSSVGVQFDWQFDDSTLSLGARRPLSGGTSAMEQDFSTTIPYIRYRKEL